MYHFLPERPLRDVPRSEFDPGSPGTRKVRRPSRGSIPMETPPVAQGPGQSARDGGDSVREQAFSTTLDLGARFLFEGTNSLVAFGARAAADLVCFRPLARRPRVLECKGFARVSAYPACARFEGGDGRLDEVRHAANIPVGNAGINGEFSSRVEEAGIPAF